LLCPAALVSISFCQNVADDDDDNDDDDDDDNYTVDCAQRAQTSAKDQMLIIFFPIGMSNHNTTFQ